MALLPARGLGRGGEGPAVSPGLPGLAGGWPRQIRAVYVWLCFIQSAGKWGAGNERFLHFVAKLCIQEVSLLSFPLRSRRV